MARTRLAVVGSSNSDMIVQLPRLPGPGETVLGHRFSIAGGGKGANQAVAAARLGAEVAFVGRVGEDDFGRARLADLRREGIDTEGVGVDPETPSGVALIFVDDSGENAIAVAPSANRRVTPEQVETARKKIEAADLLLTQLELPLPAVERAIEIARAAGTRVILDPAPPAPVPDSLLAQVDYLTPNETEAALLAGSLLSKPGTRNVKPETARNAAALLARGVGGVIVTLGERGVFVALPDGQFELPGRKVEAVDTTGAGDCFAGAFAVALGERRPLREALRFASAAAALSVTRLGAQPSLPQREEVENLLAVDRAAGRM